MSLPVQSVVGIVRRELSVSHLFRFAIEQRLDIDWR
jgi:hypothetical protein